MTSSIRLVSLALILSGLMFATPGVAADLDVLMKEFRVVPAGLTPAPAFSLKSTQGKPVAVAVQGGRPVLLYFWATWGPHCSRELPSTIEQLYRDLSLRGLSVLAVNIQESRSTVASWVKEKKVTFPILLDADGKVTGRY